MDLSLSFGSGKFNFYDVVLRRVWGAWRVWQSSSVYPRFNQHFGCPLLKYTCNYVSASFCQFFIWSLEFFKNCSRHIAQRWGWVQMSGEVCMGMWWWHVGHGTHWWYATEEGPWRCAGREHLRLVGLKHELVQYPNTHPRGRISFPGKLQFEFHKHPRPLSNIKSVGFSIFDNQRPGADASIVAFRLEYSTLLSKFTLAA